MDVIDLIATDLPDLLQALDGRGSSCRTRTVQAARPPALVLREVAAGLAHRAAAADHQSERRVPADADRHLRTARSRATTRRGAAGRRRRDLPAARAVRVPGAVGQLRRSRADRARRAVDRRREHSCRASARSASVASSPSSSARSCCSTRDVPGFGIAWQLIGAMAFVGGAAAARASSRSRCARGAVRSSAAARRMLRESAEAIEIVRARRHRPRARRTLERDELACPCSAGERLRIVRVDGLHARSRARDERTRTTRSTAHVSIAPLPSSSSWLCRAADAGHQGPERVRARRDLHVRPLHGRQGTRPDHPGPARAAHGQGRPARRRARRADAGRDLARQRLGQGQCRGLFPDRRPGASAIIQVANPFEATSQLAQTTLRSVLGQHELDEMLSQRDKLNVDIQHILDQATDAWGIKVANVEIKHVDLDESMIRAIAKQAEAERTRRAKIIHAEGEKQAAAQLVEAARDARRGAEGAAAALPADARRHLEREDARRSCSRCRST